MADSYRWTDAKGTWHQEDRLPEAGAVEQKYQQVDAAGQVIANGVVATLRSKQAQDAAYDKARRELVANSAAAARKHKDDLENAVRSQDGNYKSQMDAYDKANAAYE